MDRPSKRSNIEIMADILRLGQSGVGKTRIMYGVNMSHSQLEKYIGFLLSAHFLELEVNTGSARSPLRYRTTAKGKRLMRNIDRISELLGVSHEGTEGKAG